MSEYEKIREQRMRENKEKTEKLRIFSLSQKFKPEILPRRRGPQKRKPSVTRSITAPYERARRSPRRNSCSATSVANVKLLRLTAGENREVVLHQDETPLLYSLVFGEGVVNDSTSVVLFNAIQKLNVTKPDGRDGLHLLGDFMYIFFSSTLLGVAAGLLTAYALKVLYISRHSTDREISLMVLMAYLSYIAAELLEPS